MRISTIVIYFHESHTLQTHLLLLQHGSESIDRKLKKFHGLPLLTHEMWSEVIEKSHAPSHPLLGGKEWAGEVTKVALVREYSFRRYFDDFILGLL